MVKYLCTIMFVAKLLLTGKDWGEYKYPGIMEVVGMVQNMIICMWVQARTTYHMAANKSADRVLGQGKQL